MLENSTLGTCLNSYRNKTYGIYDFVMGRKAIRGKFKGDSKNKCKTRFLTKERINEESIRNMTRKINTLVHESI